ncbi:hypothetical protein [Enterococcus alishanensis]
MSETVQEMTVYQLKSVFQYKGVAFPDVKEVVTLDLLEEDNTLQILVNYEGKNVFLVIGKESLQKMVDLASGKEHFGHCENCQKILYEMPEQYGVGYLCHSCAYQEINYK